MSPKRNLATSGGEELEERRHQRHKGHKRQRLKRRDMEKEKEKAKLKMKNKRKEKEEGRMKLDEEEAKKSLYICTLEHRSDRHGCFVIRAIRLSDLLSSSSSSKHPLRLKQLAYKTGPDLPGSAGCGVWGSEIVFAGGLEPSMYGPGALSSKSKVWHKEVYCFETRAHLDEEDKDKDNQIRKMDSRFTLQQLKFKPFTVEICGRLYALSYKMLADPPMFEVFDPKVGRWAGLPTPPFFVANSPHHNGSVFSYAVAGTKMFVSHDKCPVFCFDVAQPDRPWRLVSTMCEGEPFPFVRRALVLDLPEDDTKKIMFAFTGDWGLRVYLMSLEENMESINLIGYVNLPLIPPELGRPSGCDIVHIGGRKACVVVSRTNLPDDEQRMFKPGPHKRWGAVIPFQFELDMSKADKGQEDCFTIQVMPHCVFKYRTNQSSLPLTETAGCFVL